MNKLFTKLAVLAASGAIGVGCAGGDEVSDTTAADVPAAAAPAAHDMAGMNRPAAKDADHEFLRMMIDHHEGMIQMGVAAMTKASTQQARDDAHKLHTKQLAEQKEMQAIVSSSYAENVMPMVMPSDKPMNGSLQQMSGVDYDRTFYGNVVRHHQAGIQMMNDFESRVQRPDVKLMIPKMKADQQREIGEFEGKIARLR